MSHRVLITGATGFVGQYVLQALLKHDGLEITAVSRQPEKLKPLAQKHAQLKVVQLNLEDAGNTSFERLGSPQTLIHLAWDGLPHYHSSHHFESQLPLQYRFLKHMVDCGLQRMLVSGTCFEYGMQSGCLDESMLCMPSNAYGFAKFSLLQQLNFLQKQKPFSLTWARLFYSYGAGQAASSLYTQLTQAIELKESVFNMSLGQQLRDFLPIETVAGILASLAIRHPSAGVVNVCSGQPISVRAFAEKLIADKKADIQLNLGHYDYPTYEPLAFWGSADKLNTLSLIE